MPNRPCIRLKQPHSLRLPLYPWPRARVCPSLSAHQVTVLDISQTITDGFFNMMMIVDYSNADEEFGTVVDDLDKLGEEIGVRLRCQREEIFTKMHRV